MDAKAIKDKLGTALASVSPGIGIALGTALFDAFRERGWLTLETFSVPGTSFFQCKLPAYQGTHPVVLTVGYRQRTSSE